MDSVLTPSPADADAPADAPWADPVGYAVALIRVAGRLARGVFVLGRTAKRHVAAARAEGRPPYVDHGRIRVRGALEVLRTALLVADAFRRRLRTPEVLRAMRRPRPEAAPAVMPAAAPEAAPAPKPAPKPQYERKLHWPIGPDMSDPMARILDRRGHPESRAGVDKMIAVMTHDEVLNLIGTYLLTAAEMLDDVPGTQGIKRVIADVAALFEGERAIWVVPRVRGALTPEEREAEERAAAERAAEMVMPQVVAPEMGAEPSAAPAAAPDATERGPPLA